jgi:alginate O-acetyltransferase complex protein AlgI
LFFRDIFSDRRLARAHVGIPRLRYLPEWGVALNKLWQLWLTRILGRKGYNEVAKIAIYIAFGGGLTFSWFAFTMFWFWANWKQIGTVFSAIAVGPWIAVWLVIWFGATVVLVMWERLHAVLLKLGTSEGPALTSRYAWWFTRPLWA